MTASHRRLHRGTVGNTMGGVGDTGKAVPKTTEAFSRVKIDAQLKDVGWTLDDAISVHFAYTLSDGTEADYVLCDRNGHPLAVLEAKRQSIMPTEARGQALHYAKLLDVPYVFLSNGDETWFWALQDVSLDIAEGEILGVIGANCRVSPWLRRASHWVWDGITVLRAHPASRFQVRSRMKPRERMAPDLPGSGVFPVSRSPGLTGVPTANTLRR